MVLGRFCREPSNVSFRQSALDLLPSGRNSAAAAAAATAAATATAAAATAATAYDQSGIDADPVA